MDIHDILDEAIAMVEAGRPRAFGNGVVIEQQPLLDLLQQARGSLPDEIMQAAEVLRERQRLMQEAMDKGQEIRTLAERDAEQIRAHAEKEREFLLDEHELIKVAEDRGRAIFANARAEVATMRMEADKYADARLAAAAETLAQAHAAIEVGRERLRSRSVDLTTARDPEPAA